MSKSTESLNVYFPMTANILTAGHIKCLEWLSKSSSLVVIGLLTTKALKGYKKEVVPFKDRKLILETIANSMNNIWILPQDSLDPSEGIYRTLCNALASGDGFEAVELAAIKRYNLKRIDIKLSGEKSKQYSSTKILRSAK